MLMIEVVIAVILLGSTIGISRVVYDRVSIALNKIVLKRTAEHLSNELLNCQHFNVHFCELRGCFFLHRCQMKDH
jgi:hypothetical protein